MDFIRIPNDNCTPGIDIWLRENVSKPDWKEWHAVHNRPFREFSFSNPKDATMFALKFR